MSYIDRICNGKVLREWFVHEKVRVCIKDENISTMYYFWVFYWYFGIVNLYSILCLVLLLFNNGGVDG